VKEKFELEYTLKTSPKILFNIISTPAGLSEWFADDVNLKGNVFTFFWDGSEQSAERVLFKENKMIRFSWLDEDDPESSWFEFRIDIHELTGDVALVITDFAEEGEKDDGIDLWDSQISELKHMLGT